MSFEGAKEFKAPQPYIRNKLDPILAIERRWKLYDGRRACTPMDIKDFGLILAYLFALVAIPFALFLAATYSDREARVCDRPVRTFSGVEYRTELCFHVNFETGEERGRLRVYSVDQSRLLAQRSFLILRLSRLGEVEYLADGIRYTDATKTQNIDLPEEKFLRFPPTNWDWLTANFVRLTYDP